ncbi:MAG: T9SS type A sorting domain-containing protein, partial [Saprospiraceae bacterium]
SHYRLAFGDLDGDGDQDIIAFNASGNVPFLYFENQGTPQSPSFAAAVSNPFGLQPKGESHTTNIFDVDLDGDLDLIVNTSLGFQYYQNTGSAQMPAFAAPVTAPFGLVVPAGINTPRASFGDLDNDGDLDALATDFNGKLIYYQNEGTRQQPAFAAPVNSPFGYTAPSRGLLVVPALEDVDRDGLLDLVVGYNPGRVVMYRNQGTKEVPAFSAPISNPFGFNTSNFRTWAMPMFVDMDNDGDRDLFISNFPQLFYFENITITTSIATPTYLPLNVYPNPASTFIFIALPSNFSLHTLATARLSDVNGNVIKQLKMTGTSKILIADLPAGYYIVTLHGINNSVFYSPIIIQNKN